MESDNFLWFDPQTFDKKATTKHVFMKCLMVYNITDIINSAGRFLKGGRYMKLRVIRNHEVTTVEAQLGDTILKALTGQPHFHLHAPCGGTGRCGKCTVYLSTPAGDSPCLSCKTPVQEGMTIRLPESTPLSIATETTVCGDGSFQGYGIACDIGTTTVVCHLIQRATGKIIATAAEENQQRRYGADVISRINAAEATDALTRCIREQLATMIHRLCTDGIFPQQITAMTIAANPTMCHFLAGLDPSPLGKAPYQPETYFGKWYSAETMELPIGGMVYILPSVSGFVGGDILGDALTLSLNRLEKPVLMIDVGTNGEILLGCKDHFLCCSTAAGPAFEGAEITCGCQATVGAIHAVQWTQGGLRCQTIQNAPPTGICGSGLMDAVAALLSAGAIDKTGRMLDADQDTIPEELEPYMYFENGEPAFSLCEGVFIAQSDIRKLQLAKAAIAAGVEVLCKKAGNPKIETLFLAGGFPISPASVAKIGLIPKELMQVSHSVGNGAIGGAIALLCDKEAQMQLETLQKCIHPIELSGTEDFQEAYIRHMNF